MKLRPSLLIALVLIGAAAAATWYVYADRPTAPGQAQASGQASNQRRRTGGRRGGVEPGDPIPVLTATAMVADVPEYLDALGTVQAFNTVNIKAMIDGPLATVAFVEGQDVKAGDVLARIDPRPYQAALDQMVAKKAQDEANLANARVDLVRYQKLVATNYTSGQTSDTQKALVAQDVALTAQDQAQIDTARTNLSYTTITSPITGRTGIRQLDQGNIIHSADTSPLVVITQLQPISVLFNLPQQTLPDVATAMRLGAPKVLAYPQGLANAANTPEDQGTLAVLDNTVDQNTGTIKLKATFPNTDLLLWPGGFINVRLLVRTELSATTLPPSAVQRGPAGTFVYAVNDDNTVTRKQVKVGHEDEATSVILAGVQPGERVVTDGASRLTDGAKIQLQPPGEPPEADTAHRTAHTRQRASAAP